MLAGCAGGPISDFPDKAPGGGGGAPGPIKANAGDGDGDSLPPRDDGDSTGGPEFPSDGEFDNGGDAGLPSFPDRPCGAAGHADSDGGLPATLGEGGDGGVCVGDQCPITRRQLSALATEGACTSAAEIDLVCDGELERAIGLCNESSLQDSAGFGLVQNCVLTDPAVSSASEACVDCYLDANRCALLNCLSECLVPASAEACDACRQNQCGAALSACTGLPAL